MKASTQTTPTLDSRVFPPHVLEGLAPLQIKALEFAHKRTQKAMQVFHRYQIVACNPQLRYVFVQGEGKPVHRVVWQGNYVCNCGDAANLRRCERELSDAGLLCDDTSIGGTRGKHACHLCCIHVGIVIELVVTQLGLLGDDILSYLDHPDPVWAALPVAFPGLPTTDPTPFTEEDDA